MEPKRGMSLDETAQSIDRSPRCSSTAPGPACPAPALAYYGTGLVTRAPRHELAIARALVDHSTGW